MSFQAKSGSYGRGHPRKATHIESVVSLGHQVGVLVVGCILKI